jgi:hypothetical protein
MLLQGAALGQGASLTLLSLNLKLKLIYFCNY